MTVNILEQLESTFNQRKVDIVEFAESKEFCNRPLYPRQKLLLKLMFLEELNDREERILDYWIAGGAGGSEIRISPNIRERIKWLRDNGYKHFSEVVMVGGRRCSKGHVTAIALAKKMYDTLQLQDPGAHYGIPPDKEIYFSCIAASQEQAKEAQYADLSATVMGCQAMAPYIHKMQALEFSVETENDKRERSKWKRAGRRVEKDISKLRGNALPANARTIRGKTTMVYVFDEFAWFQQGESDQSDSNVYSAATPSLAQFGRDSMIFSNSSPYSKVGKFHERWEESQASDEGYNPRILGIQLPSWALFEGWWEDPDYTGPAKCITVSPDWDVTRTKPNGELFYAEADRHAILKEQSEEKDNAQKYKVERRGQFAEVVDAYLIPEMVDRMFEGRPVGYNTENRVVYEPMRTNYDDSRYIYRYYGHLDPSSTTAGFGFALAHVDEFHNNDRVEQHVVFDIIKRWNPRDFEDHTIDWEPILEELVRLCDIFRPVQLTMDQHQSHWPLQWLRKTLRAKGIETRVFEKVATSKGNWNRAEVFRTALNQGLIHAPYDNGDCHYAGEELKYLQEIKTSMVPRIEKQDVGPVQTKDIADAMMEVVEACIGNLIAVGEREELGMMGLRSGSPGGYQIGGFENGVTGRAAELTAMYSRRHGDQRFGGRVPKARVSPSRRPVGGKPIPRRLPGS